VGTGPELAQSEGRSGPGFHVEAIASTTGRADFERAVARAVEYIHAGDCFQVNLAHHLVGRFSGSSRAAFIATTSTVRPWYGAYVELPADALGRRRAVLSLSPELFLELDGVTRRVVTRPIKGTRRAGPRSTADLGASAKDHAELAMIIDLMRNDLGRACRVGSIRVDDPRAIERHAGTLDHGVATVSGTLREDAGLDTLLAATFPPGSVTGAPKVRAMQIIDELEARPRGVYCGCVGFVSACGNAAFNVAIRTATIEQPGVGGHQFNDATIDLPVGAGIVAESTPASEWQETLDKAEAIERALSASSGCTVSKREAPDE
jgi:anthranilate/para-aminobenzoate synthase component I